MRILGLYALTFLTFLGIDMIWLGFVGKPFYDKSLGYIKADNVNWIAAILFYLIFVAGLLYFVVLPALKEGSMKKATLNGAILGFLTYATFDLTSLAVLKDWPVDITIIDLCWGTFLGATVCTVSYYIGSKIL